MLKKFILYTKGLLMGIADVIPGVSGGTIALISGIYLPLLQAITAVNIANIKLLLSGHFMEFWRNTRLAFLLPILLGIGSSILLFSHLIHYLLDQYDLFVWAFFLGLVIGSVFLLTKQLERWTLKMAVTFIASMVIAYGLVNSVHLSLPVGYISFFIGGFIAICAMILPGISGSFLLLMMGLYQPVIMAVTNMQLANLAVFAMGAVLGLLTFSRLISFLLSRWPKLLMAAMIGIIVGSVKMLWPWQISLNQIKFIVMPNIYQTISGNDPHILMVAGCFCIGFIAVIGIYRLSQQKNL